MKINPKNYVCSICGKRNLKLWRPIMDTDPLICAECAEKRQTPRESLPKWKVNKDGEVPSYDDLGPTDQLIVDLSDVSPSYKSVSTSMVPAKPNEKEGFWAYGSAPEEVHKWWDELPTR